MKTPPASSVDSASARVRFQIWNWAFFAGMMAWGLFLVSLAFQLLTAEKQTSFLETGRKLMSHDALSAADVLITEEALLAQVYVRRLAGEEWGRYAILMDRRGRVVASAGSLPGQEEESRLSREALAAKDFHVVEVPGAPASLELSHPVWVRNEKWGVLRWGVWTEVLEEHRRRHLARLFLTWSLAVLIGGAGTYLFLKISPP